MPSVAPIVGVDWVRARLGDIVVADVRWYLDGRPGRAAYEAAHLPGAVFVDVDTDLSAPGLSAPGLSAPAPTDGRHPLPGPEEFAAALGRLGIGAGDVVVAYDDTGGGTAGRLVWMLRVLDREAALLDGGLAAWDGPLEQGSGSPRPPVAVAPQPWPARRIADADAVARATASGSAVVLDARAAERYEGALVLVDKRPGHVPGSRSAPWASNLRPDGRMQDVDELRRRFADLGIGAGTPVIAYCGSGVSACAELLALEAAGIEDTRLYPASWSGWSADPDRPAATGPDVRE